MAGGRDPSGVFGIGSRENRAARGVSIVKRGSFCSTRVMNVAPSDASRIADTPGSEMI